MNRKAFAPLLGLALLAAPAAYAGDGHSFGISLTAPYAPLTANPAGFASPDCSGPQGPCFFPSVNADSAWGYGAGVGFHYKLSPSLALGGSYNTKTKFQEFVWHAAAANPHLASFGTDRKIRQEIDMPAVGILGLGWTPTDRLAVAIDGKWIDYESAAGFKDA